MPKKKPKKQEKKSNFMLWLTIGAMVLSGFIIFGGTQQQTQTGLSLPEIKFYDAKQTNDYSIIAEVVELKPELVAKLSYPLDYSSITYLSNLSIDGLEKTEIELGDAKTDGSYLTGTYFIYTFTFEDITENRTDALVEELDTFIGRNSYVLLRGSIAFLSTNESTYLPCALDSGPGDRYRVFLIEKELDGYPEGSIAFAANKVDVGPEISGEVVEVTDYIISGALESGFDPLLKNLSEEIMVNPAAYLVEESLSNQALEALEELAGVTVSSAGNSTRITYNSSAEEIETILAGKTLNPEPGYVGFSTGLETDLSELNNTLQAYGASNITYMKKGLVEVAPQMLIDGTLVDIPNNKKLPARLRLETEAGDEVEIYLTTLQFGEEIMIVDASELV